MDVTRALEHAEDVKAVPPGAPNRRRQVSGMVRDTWDDGSAAFVVRDGNYMSARWPEDTHTSARVFAGLLDAKLLSMVIKSDERASALFQK